MRVVSMDDEEEMFLDDEQLHMHKELQEKVRLAFIMLADSRVIDEEEDNLVLAVNLLDLQEFSKPSRLSYFH